MSHSQPRHVGAVGPDVDAFRRTRVREPLHLTTPLMAELQKVLPGESPVVVFNRVAALCVAHFSHSCDVEIREGAEPAFRSSHGTTAAASPVGSGPEPAQQPASVVSVPVLGRARWGYGSFAGVVHFQWREREASSSEVLVAELVVQHATALVEQGRLAAHAQDLEAKVGHAAMDAIVSRQLNIATGVVRRDHASDEEMAEETLRELATRAGVPVYTMAVRVVMAARSEGEDDTDLDGPGRSLHSV